MKRTLAVRSLLETSAPSQMMASESRFKQGQRVWIEGGGKFIQGTVLEAKQSTLVVQLAPSEWTPEHDEETRQTSSIAEVGRHMAYEVDEDFHHADNAELNYLNYPNVLENVTERYKIAGVDEARRHWIYTYAGCILFALNPYHDCSQLYTDEVVARYYGKTITQEDPHPFAIASMAFSRLIHEHQSQYILISGESGGGKTECSKHVLRFLTWVSRRQRRLRGRPSVEGPGDAAQTLARLLTDANPLLEFFGNAKTTRNDNSSRFGRLLQIFFDDTGEHLVAARLQTYLLAKSRVVQVPAGEENYHAFHSIIEGLDEQTRQLLLLDPGFTSPFLGDCSVHPTNYYTPGGIFHVRRLIETLEEFGLTEREVLDLLKVLSAILHLGNITFESDPDGGACHFASNTAATKVCTLLGIEGGVSQLQTVLTSKQIRDTRRHLNLSESRRMMFSMAKGLYETLFHYVLALVGFRLESENTRFTSEIQTSLDVNILDLFGFENMEPTSHNGFEQLCINYANEQLHHHFMLEVVQREKEIYRDEGLVILDPAILASTIPDSEALAMLLGARGISPGIFAVLDDNCKLGAHTNADPDTTFCRQTISAIERVRAAREGSPPKRRRAEVSAACSSFCINHFAEEVAYTADGFTERNQDYMSQELLEFLTSSTGAHIQKLFSAVPNAACAGSKTASLSAVFIKQLSALLSRLTDRTSCYFIKCLKPNELQAPFTVNKQLILRQLITGGVGPVLNVMKAGYPCRLTFDTIWKKYRNSLPPEFAAKLSPRDFAELVTSFLQLSPDSYRLGTTRVFFRLGVLQKMEQLMLMLDDNKQVREFADAIHRYSVERRLVRIVQTLLVVCRFRKVLARFRYRNIARDAVRVYREIWLPRQLEARARIIQKWFRQRQERQAFLRSRRAILRIQRFYRRRSALSWIIKAARWCELQRSGRFIQSLLVKNFLMMRAHECRIVRAAIWIQAHWRGYYTRKRMQEMFEQCRREEAALTIWNWWLRHKQGARLRKANTSHTQLKPPLSPVARTAFASKTFQDTRDYWEVASTSPCLPRTQVGQEVLRRRRSLFATTSADFMVGGLLTQAPAAAAKTVARVKCQVAASPSPYQSRVRDTPRFATEQMDDDNVTGEKTTVQNEGAFWERPEWSPVPHTVGNPSKERLEDKLVGPHSSSARRSYIPSAPTARVPATTATNAGEVFDFFTPSKTSAAVFEGTEQDGLKRTSLMPPSATARSQDTVESQRDIGITPSSINKSVAWLRTCTKVDPDVEPQKSITPMWPPLHSGRMSVYAWAGVGGHAQEEGEAEATPLFGSGRGPTPPAAISTTVSSVHLNPALPSDEFPQIRPLEICPSIDQQENTPVAISSKENNSTRSGKLKAWVIQDVSMDRCPRCTKIPSHPVTAETMTIQFR